MSPSKDSPPSAPKVAVKGFSLTSFTSSKPGASSTKVRPLTTLGKRPRSTFASHDSDSDSDHERKVTHEVVTGFGAEGAIRHDAEEAKRKSAGPLVIKRLKNRDWKAEARKRQGKNLLPAEVQAARARQEVYDGGETSNEGGKMEGVDVVNGNDEAITWGLSVRKRVRVEEPASGSGSAVVDARGEAVVEEKVEEKPLSADEEALQALLGTKKEVKEQVLVIQATREDSATPEVMTETDAYKRAIALAPDVSTLEDYERVPVEEFGAALLRGMGWKGNKVDGAREVVRRQNLLGLGAKELKGAEELGAWVQKSDVKRLRPGTDKGNGGGFGGGGGDRRPKASEYRREKERRDERREERGGGSYRRERERDSYRERDRDGHRRH